MRGKAYCSRNHGRAEHLTLQQSFLYDHGVIGNYHLNDRYRGLLNELRFPIRSQSKRVEHEIDN